MMLSAYRRFGQWPRFFMVTTLAMMAWAQAITILPAAASVGPSPRGRPAMAADPNGRLVLFGGLGPQALNDTWTWNGNAWAELSPSTRPAARYAAAMAGDPSTGTVVLFGGFGDELGTGAESYLADTWTWNGRTKSWAKRTPPTSPSPRGEAAMAYDAATGTVVLFGGNGIGGQLGDTWIWNGREGTWTPRLAMTAPTARLRSTMAYDKVSRSVVLFGGQEGEGAAPVNDTWTWDGTMGTWTRQTPTASPPERSLAFMSAHPATGTVVLFGGAAMNGEPTRDTWAWRGDTKTWSKKTPVNRPCPRLGGAMAYHSGTTSSIMFGGQGGTNSTCQSGPGTWGWNGTNWKLNG